jgi:hypothetical protein
MAFPVRNTAWSGVTAQMVNATTGAAFVGTVTCYVDGDNSGQLIGQTASGVCASVGNGAYVYVPAAAETNYTVIAFTFVGPGAVPQTVTIATITAAQSASISVSTAAGAIPVSTIINYALKRVNVLQPGQVADANQMGDALQWLNFMIDSWAADRMTMPYQQVTTWSLTSTKGTPSNPYTVGAGGDINVARPTYIDHINYRDDSLTVPLERPLTPLTRDAYDAIPLKTLTNTLPGAYYYQPTFTNNLGSLYLWMVPTQAQLTGVMYAPSAIAQFGSATATVILPPAYLFALEENLAVLLASIFRENLPPDPFLIQNARDLKAALKRPNNEIMDMSFDPALTMRNGVYDISSDTVPGRP